MKKINFLYKIHLKILSIIIHNKIIDIFTKTAHNGYFYDFKLAHNGNLSYNTIIYKGDYDEI